MQFMCRNVEDLQQIAPRILDELATIRVILLRGDLGAGKTALVQAICAALGVEDVVTSPTFALVNQYLDGDDRDVYHIDLYRLQSLEEALHIGIEDYLDSGSWCFVEWPEILDPILLPPYAIIEIKVDPEAHRKIRILKVHALDKP